MNTLNEMKKPAIPEIQSTQMNRIFPDKTD